MARPRSEEAHRKVLLAAIDLFAERGIEAASMDAIARASGVSKATIYKHWTDKEALLMEVLELVHGLKRQPVAMDSGDLAADLKAVLIQRPPDEFDQQRVLMTPALIAYSATHEEFGLAWRRRVTEPARACLTEVLKRAMERGQITEPVEIEDAVAMLMGPMLYAHIFGQRRGREPGGARRDLGPVVAAAFVRAFARHGKG